MSNATNERDKISQYMQTMGQYMLHVRIKAVIIGSYGDIEGFASYNGVSRNAGLRRNTEPFGVVTKHEFSRLVIQKHHDDPLAAHSFFDVIQILVLHLQHLFL